MPPKQTSAMRSSFSRTAANLPRVPSRRQSQEPRRVAAEDGDLLFVAERCCCNDMIDRMGLPGIGIVTPQHDLARSHLGHEMAEFLGGEDERVEVEVLQIFARTFGELNVLVAEAFTDIAGMIRARRIRGKIAAAMSGQDLEAGK